MRVTYLDVTTVESGFEPPFSQLSSMTCFREICSFLGEYFVTNNYAYMPHVLGRLRCMFGQVSKIIDEKHAYDKHLFIRSYVAVLIEGKMCRKCAPCFVYSLD